MESNAVIQGEVGKAFVEEHCTITHEGRSFTSGGAWLAKCTDGYWRGVVYVSPRNGDGHLTEPDDKGMRRWNHAPHGSCGGIVTTWHGKKIADAWFGARYQSTYCRLRAVSFTYTGMKFTGRYCPDTSGACRVLARKV